MHKVDKIVYGVVIAMLIGFGMAPTIIALFTPQRYADLAVYDQLNGSQYSCNELGAERAYYSNPEHPNKAIVMRRDQQLAKHCPNY